MATKRRTTTRRTVTTARRSGTYRRRRKSSGYDKIPSAGASVGLALANLAPVNTVLSDMSASGIKSGIAQALTKDQLIRSGVGVAGGYIAGEAIRRYAPRFIKKPLGAIAKKIPKVF